jgi:hypothetical protein
LTAYNVVDPAKMVTGQPEDITPILANFNAIAAVLNGGLDNANLKADAAIAASKLAGYPSDALKKLAGDGSWSPPAVLTSVGPMYPIGPTSINSTGNGDAIINFPAATFENVLHYWEIAAAIFDTAGNGKFTWRLHDGYAPGPLVNEVYQITPAVNPGSPSFFRIPFTPSAGLHYYHLRWRAIDARTFFGDSSCPLTSRIVKASGY